MSQTVQNKEVSLPRGALIGVGLVVGLALLSAIVGRLQGPPPGPVSTVQATRTLLFSDMADGSVGVVDAANGARVAVLAPGSNNFIRALLRGLVHARRSERPNPMQPFVLTAWADGRLTLVDSADGRSIELEAFGSTNEAAFARLLTVREEQK